MKQHIKNVVLVHGAFADGSGWEAVAMILKNDGYKVSVAQPPGFRDGYPAFPSTEALAMALCKRRPWQIEICGERVDAVTPLTHRLERS